MRMFSVNFRPENFNWMLSSESAKRASEEELRQCDLIKKPVMSKKLDDKVARMLAIPVV